MHPVAPVSAPKPEMQPVNQAPVAANPAPAQTVTPVSVAVPASALPQTPAQPITPSAPIAQQPPAQPKKPVSQMAAQSISIRNIPEKKAQVKEDTPAYQAVASMNTPINLNDMERLWVYYANQIPKERILAQKAMISSKIVFLNENQFELMIDSPHQKDILLDELPAVVGFLQRELRNNVFRFSLRVIEPEERPRIFSPQDKFKAMVNSNPALYEFVEKFGLEIA
jgi:DNA polymerase-3 subunit gamma/tau